MLLTFVVTNHVFVNSEEVSDCLSAIKIKRERSDLIPV